MKGLRQAAVDLSLKNVAYTEIPQVYLGAVTSKNLGFRHGNNNCRKVLLAIKHKNIFFF